MYLIDYYHFPLDFSCNRGKSIKFVALIKNYSAYGIINVVIRHII